MSFHLHPCLSIFIHVFPSSCMSFHHFECLSVFDSIHPDSKRRPFAFKSSPFLVRLLFAPTATYALYIGQCLPASCLSLHFLRLSFHSCLSTYFLSFHLYIFRFANRERSKKSLARANRERANRERARTANARKPRTHNRERANCERANRANPPSTCERAINARINARTANARTANANVRTTSAERANRKRANCERANRERANRERKRANRERANRERPNARIANARTARDLRERIFIIQNRMYVKIRFERIHWKDEFTTAFFTVPPGEPGERDQIEVESDVRHTEDFNARGRMLL